MKYQFCGLEKVSLVDYEGYVVTTLFTNGCNFQCPFCHNAPLALNQIQESISFDEILSYLEKRKGLIEGVCITGGEPTLLPDLLSKLKEIKKRGFLVKLDTNGSNPKLLKTLIESRNIDYIAMDIKNGPTNYPKTIGLSKFDLSPIQESIALLIHGNIEYEFRATIVEELHSITDIEEIGILLKDASKLYLQKFVERDTCIQKGLHEISKEKALAYQNLLSKFIQNVYLRGYS